MSKDNSGLFIVAIFACVAIVTLFWMVQYSQQAPDVSEEQVLIVDEGGNVVGMGPGIKVGFYGVTTMILAGYKALTKTPDSPGDPDILVDKSSEGGEGDGDASGGEEDGEDEDNSETSFHGGGCPEGYLC